MATSEDKTLSMLIKRKALGLGFDLCGIARSKILADHKPVIENWCSSGMNGDIGYIYMNVDKRINPDLLFPGAKSVIVTGLNYYADKKQGGDGVPVISRYAYGVNYHDIIKEKLDNLLEYINTYRPDAEGKSFVDSAPILEKAWAREAGLGWPGRHSVLINNKIGSFFFLGVILLNIDLDYDEPFKEDLCGSCRVCVDSCPTKAINENRTLDVRRCIAYLTIESKSPVPDELAPKMEGRVFGCDKCQEVCPWNKNAKPNNNLEFELPEEITMMTKEDWLNLSKDQFKRLFKGTAIERRKYEPFRQNVTNVTKDYK
ncbi:MAG: tRNA epoxyqueuosine(34) reductase QueG [Bacteroidota bacterium]